MYNINLKNGKKLLNFKINRIDTNKRKHVDCQVYYTIVEYNE